MTAESLARQLPGARRMGGQYMAPCPAHEDRSPSLAIRDGDNGVVIHCHAGCAQGAVITALKAAGLWEPRPDYQQSRIVATYDYCDAEGTMRYQVCRREPKAFLQRYPDGRGGWIWKKHPDQLLYRLREVLESPIIFLTEGEKDVETLRSHGFIGTTAAGGARAPWLPQYTDALRGREVILIPDADIPGRQRAATIAHALMDSVARLTWLDLPRGKDITEWFELGGSETGLIALIDSREACID